MQTDIKRCQNTQATAFYIFYFLLLGKLRKAKEENCHNESKKKRNLE